MSKASFHKEEASAISVRENWNIWKQGVVSDSCFLSVCLLSRMDRWVLPVRGRCLLGPTKPLRQRSHVRNHQSAGVPPAVHLQMLARIHRWDVVPSVLFYFFAPLWNYGSIQWYEPRWEGKLVMGCGMSDCVWGKLLRAQVCFPCFVQ